MLAAVETALTHDPAFNAAVPSQPQEERERWTALLSTHADLARRLSMETSDPVDRVRLSEIADGIAGLPKYLDAVKQRADADGRRAASLSLVSHIALWAAQSKLRGWFASKLLQELARRNPGGQVI